VKAIVAFSLTSPDLIQGLADASPSLEVMALMNRSSIVQHSIIAIVATVAIFGGLGQGLGFMEKRAGTAIAPEMKNKNEERASALLSLKTDRKNQAAPFATAKSPAESFGEHDKLAEEHDKLAQSMFKWWLVMVILIVILGCCSCLLFYGAIGAGLWAIFSSGGRGGDQATADD